MSQTCDTELGLGMMGGEILESISDGVFTVDSKFRITFFNRAAERITGVPRAKALGRLCSEVLRSSSCERDCALRGTLESGRPVIDRHCHIIDSSGRKLPISISTAVLKDSKGRVVGGAETFRDLSEIEELRRELSGRVEFGDVVSRSPAMRKVIELALAVAASDSTVLVSGETGTGKELMARAIHGRSLRASKPFVAVNCGALPDALLESELFGCKAGAFTGAVKDRAGRFAAAEGGTLLLDEIGETSPAMQVRLLRVLQERSYEPLGSSVSRKCDVRVIAATNRSLEDEVAKRAFRKDLFYRINVIRIDVPPLRERPEDVPILVERFIERLSIRQRKPVGGISPAALSALVSCRWPGNVRELENVIERAFVLCPKGGVIEARHLPPGLRSKSPSVPAGGLREGVSEAERRIISDALERNGQSRQAAARELGMHRATLHRRMKALGLS